MMKCKIVRNEDIIFVSLLIFIIGVDCSYLSSNSQSIQDLCSSNGYIYTVRPEEPQQLKLTYNTTSKEINKWYQKSKHKCRKEFKTNDGASHFVITVSNMSIPSCSEKCQCNYFEIAEPGNTAKFCGNHKEAIYFESKSDYFSIDFLHGLSMQFDVTLDFTVQRNAYIITGVPNEDTPNSGHFIETPYFPNTYQSDYTSEYFFRANAEDGHVMLLFLDFQIAPSSYIEIVGQNSTIPEKFYGDVFRPPAFVSQYNELTLKFKANRQPGSGFRAVSYFIRSADIPAVKPYTGCGGLKIGYGGSIILEKRDNKLYDCLWHIGAPIVPQAKIYLTVTNISLINVGPEASLEFREGHNSKSNIVKTIDCINSNCSLIPFEITVNAYNGLYVRFTGKLNQSSFVGMVYSTYYNGNCSLEQCGGRCLPPQLICDGLKHCPDGSDELECTKTFEAATTPVIVKKKSTSAKASAAFNVVFSFGICGLLVVVAVVCIIIIRGIKTVPPPPEQAVLPEVISEMSGPLPRAYSVGSTYDHLPSYEDFIQASDRYPPLLYTRAAKRNSEPYAAAHSNLLHTTSFCCRSGLEQGARSATNISSSHSVSMETVFPDEASISPEPSCSFDRSNFDWTIDKQNLRSTKSNMKRAWSSDSKLNQLNANDCHLHLSITHCIYSFCQCSQNQYYSLPLNFKINDIDIILPSNTAPKISRNRPLSFCCDSNSRQSKILTIKTRCQSDPCHFSVHYSLH